MSKGRLEGWTRRGAPAAGKQTLEGKAEQKEELGNQRPQRKAPGRLKGNNSKNGWGGGTQKRKTRRLGWGGRQTGGASQVSRRLEGGRSEG